MRVGAAKTRRESLVVEFLCVVPGGAPEKKTHRLAPAALKRKREGEGASRGRSEENSAGGGGRWGCHVTERATARRAGLKTQKNAAVGEVSDLCGSCFHV